MSRNIRIFAPSKHAAARRRREAERCEDEPAHFRGGNRPGGTACMKQAFGTVLKQAGLTARGLINDEQV